MKQFAVARIADDVHDVWYAVSVIESPKDLADFHKDFVKYAKSYKAEITNQSLTECVAQVGKLRLSYKVSPDKPDLPWHYCDRDHWNSYRPKKSPKKVK